MPVFDGNEYTCPYDEFTAERARLHKRIIEAMSTSRRTAEGPDTVPKFTADITADTCGRTAVEAAGQGAASRSRASVGGPLADRFADRFAESKERGKRAEGEAAPREEGGHVFVVVGVPGSGKDTVIKRYLRSLGLPLLDASADLCKEYLAAWGEDELSTLVRRNNEEHGPGKHLLRE